jgi:hypothetical protein
MAKKPKGKGLDPGSSPGRRGSRRLKVFRTPIGFHDAYVAAPSQKAALEAWGADGNLFAQGIAEQVDDPKLIEEPLARPGEVIKRVRGSLDEHVAALGKKDRPSPRSPAASRPLPRGEGERKKRPKPRPSRDALDAAEEALEKAEKKQRKKLRAMDEEIQALERKRRELQRKHESERDDLAGKRDRARAAYERAMDAWRSG